MIGKESGLAIRDPLIETHRQHDGIRVMFR